MRLVFLGTPEVAVATLDALLASDHEVVGVVTQPDRVRKRGREASPSPVKLRALDTRIPVLQPESPKQGGFADELRGLSPDALVVVAYGHILPRAVLEVAPAINAHFSLLPRYRGAAPVQRALMAGETETGVTVFLLEPSVDSGPVLQVERTAIALEDDAGSLLARLAPIGARLVLRALADVAAGRRGLDQDAGNATPAPKIAPEDREIDWSAPATLIANRIRGLTPEPGAFTTFRGKRLLIRRAHLADAVSTRDLPGTLVSTQPFRVATGDGLLELVEVQPEGKRAMDAAEFARGSRPAVGEVLGGS